MTDPDEARWSSPALRRSWPLAAAVGGLLVGAVAALAGADAVADVVWGGTVVAAMVPLAVDVVGGLRRREPGVDVVALLAMAGALVLGELLAGAVIAVMLTGGRALEAAAAARARRELTALLAAAPRTAHRRHGDAVEVVPVDEVRPGELLVVPPGAAVPVDGIAVGVAVLDESALTGESRPVERLAGERVASGAVNGGGPFDLRAVSTAATSTYAGIVRLVREAEDARAPFVRLADRGAAVFVPFALAVAGVAWAVSGDPRRALAVLVVATPCPLLLAAPVAVVAGISRAARRGVIVKGGAALERLAAARTVLLDKTGTLTTGHPRVADVEGFGAVPADEVLRLAAGLEQVSSHPFAPAVVRAARQRGLVLGFPSAVEEAPGAGVEGTVDGHRVAIGSTSFVAGRGALPPAVRAVRRRAALEGASAVLVAVDGVPAGALVLDDPLRAEAPRALRGLRRRGVEQIVVLSGDQADVADLVGAAVGADRVLAERSPADKVQAVRDAGPDALMVGDGVNDAPALAAAGVGVAMGARGTAASAQAADVVLAVDRLDRLPEALEIAQRSRRIARQSVFGGMAAAGIAMGFAAAGLLAPVGGALVQEAIDLAAIGNALRALGRRRPAPASAGLGLRFVAEHRGLLGGVAGIRDVADRLDALPAEQVMPALIRVRAFLVQRLIPHEEAEEAELYPLLAKAGADPTGPMVGAHREIARLVRLFGGLVDALPADGLTIGPEDRRELRRLLYGLHAVLRLHFAAEEEAYAAVDDGWATDGPPAMLTPGKQHRSEEAAP